MIWVLFGEVYWSSGFWSSQSAWLNSFSDRNLLYFPSFCCFGSLPVNFQPSVSDRKLVIYVGFLFYEPNHIFCDLNSLIMTTHTHRLLTCLLVGCFQKEWNKNNTSSVATILYVLHSDKDTKLRLSNLSFFFCFSHQGRHVKTGQLAAIKVMDVTEVSKCHIIWFRLWN